MRLAKMQRRAKSRMKKSTGLLCQEEIGMARFFASYYSNFALGMGVALFGYKRETDG